MSPATDSWIRRALRVQLVLAWLSSTYLLTNLPSALADDSAQPSNVAAESNLTERINSELRAKYTADGIVPAAVCSDETFLRRAYLDLAGRIPTASERETFLNSSDAHKRSALVDQLVQSEDYVQNFADTYDTLLMGRIGTRRYEERQKHWRPYLERVFRENRPWNQVAREVLLARPESDQDEGSVWFLYERNDNYQAIAEAVAPAFFGIRIDCAQCHDHMIATEIEQQHYWGLVAFYNRGKNEKTKNGPRVVESAIGGFSEFANLEGSSSPNVLTFYDAKTVEEARPDKDAKQEDSEDLYEPSSLPDEPRVPKFSRREKFVDEILKDHPLLAKSFVNRAWAMLMGRGIVHPFDQMNSVHEPSHPQLLEMLATDFRESGYDIRRLMAAIAKCDAYQLDAVRPAGVDDPASFAWYLERPLTAEQLTRSIQVALSGQFDNHHALLPKIRERMPTVLPENIVTEVGDALFLSNNPAINQYIEESCAADRLLGRVANSGNVDDGVRGLFVAFFGRTPNADEQTQVQQYVTTKIAAGEQPTAVWQQVAWAMLASAEFRFNH